MKLSNQYNPRTMKMSNLSLKKIRAEVEKKGGTYKKLNARLNGYDAYEVNGKMLTKPQMIERYLMGVL